MSRYEEITLKLEPKLIDRCNVCIVMLDEGKFIITKVWINLQNKNLSKDVVPDILLYDECMNTKVNKECVEEILASPVKTLVIDEEGYVWAKNYLTYRGKMKLIEKEEGYNE